MGEHSGFGLSGAAPRTAPPRLPPLEPVHLGRSSGRSPLASLRSWGSQRRPSVSRAHSTPVRSQPFAGTISQVLTTSQDAVRLIPPPQHGARQTQTVRKLVWKQSTGCQGPAGRHGLRTAGTPPDSSPCTQRTEPGGHGPTAQSSVPAHTPLLSTPAQPPQRRQNVRPRLGQPRAQWASVPEA